MTILDKGLLIAIALLMAPMMIHWIFSVIFRRETYLKSDIERYIIAGVMIVMCVLTMAIFGIGLCNGKL